MRIFATIHPKPEHAADAMQAVMDIVDETRAEAGCVKFDLFVSPDGGTLFLDEMWTDGAALEAHYAQPYTKRVFECYKTWLIRPPEVAEIIPVDVVLDTPESE